jgi:hypothetical protein
MRECGVLGVSWATADVRAWVCRYVSEMLCIHSKVCALGTVCGVLVELVLKVMIVDDRRVIVRRLFCSALRPPPFTHRPFTISIRPSPFLSPPYSRILFLRS